MIYRIYDEFLSCLCGSEPFKRGEENSLHFLSCLCGSERQVGGFANLAWFLSCLCGSEREGIASITYRIFSELPMRQ